MRLFEIQFMSNEFRSIFESKEDWIIQNMGQKILASAKRENPPQTDLKQVVAELKNADPSKGKY